MPLIGERPDLDFNAVVYATDFSLCSQNAGNYAAFMAAHFSAKLLVAHAFILSQPAMEAEIDRSLISQQRKDLEFLLSRKAFALSRGSIQSSPVLEEGNPRVVIPNLAAKHAPSLIVLGTHGGGWVERELIGSVAESIVRSTSCPALTVGPQVRSAADTTVPFRRILFATDFTPAAARAAVYAISFAQAFKTTVDILHVVPSHAITHPDRLTDLTDRFYRALDEIVPEQAKEFCDPRTFVEVGRAHHQILQHLQERAIDLLVLGIAESSHLGIQARNSGVFRLIIRATCPVLTIVG